MVKSTEEKVIASDQSIGKENLDSETKGSEESKIVRRRFLRTRSQRRFHNRTILSKNRRHF